MDQELALRQSQSLTSQAHSGLTNTGKCSIDLAGHPLTNEDFIQLVDTLKILFPDHNSQSGLSGADEARVTLLFADLLNEGWSGERFELTINRFRRHKFFGKWMPSDFYECSPENDLHDYNWAFNEIQTHQGEKNMDDMEGFRLSGVGPSLWRYKSNVILPPEFVKIHPPSGKNWHKGKQR